MVGSPSSDVEVVPSSIEGFEVVQHSRLTYPHILEKAAKDGTPATLPQIAGLLVDDLSYRVGSETLSDPDFQSPFETGYNTSSAEIQGVLDTPVGPFGERQEVVLTYHGPFEEIFSLEDFVARMDETYPGGADPQHKFGSVALSSGEFMRAVNGRGRNSDFPVFAYNDFIQSAEREHLFPNTFGVLRPVTNKMKQVASDFVVLRDTLYACMGSIGVPQTIADFREISVETHYDKAVTPPSFHPLGMTVVSEIDDTHPSVMIGQLAADAYGGRFLRRTASQRERKEPSRIIRGPWS